MVGLLLTDFFNGFEDLLEFISGDSESVVPPLHFQFLDEPELLFKQHHKTAENFLMHWSLLSLGIFLDLDRADLPNNLRVIRVDIVQILSVSQFVLTSVRGQ